MTREEFLGAYNIGHRDGKEGDYLPNDYDDIFHIEEPKTDVFDKIRAEIEQRRQRYEAAMYYIDAAREQELSWVLEVIDKYKGRKRGNGMTREEAKSILIREQEEDPWMRTEHRKKVREATKIAIKALEEPKTDVLEQIKAEIAYAMDYTEPAWKGQDNYDGGLAIALSIIDKAQKKLNE